MDAIIFSNGLTAHRLTHFSDEEYGMYSVDICGFNDPLVIIAHGKAHDGMDYHGPCVRKIRLPKMA